MDKTTFVGKHIKVEFTPETEQEYAYIMGCLHAIEEDLNIIKRQDKPSIAFSFFSEMALANLQAKGMLLEMNGFK